MVNTIIPNSVKDVLIIEDEGDICFLLNMILKGKQIQLEHVNTLYKAKAFLSEHKPALVFLDNSLPDGRGTDFIDYIKLNSPDTKIILMTAYTSLVEKDRAKEHGADVFLEKPFTRKQIYNSVNALLELDPRIAA